MPTAVFGWTEAMANAVDFAAMPTPSVPVRLTLVPPPPPKWTRRWANRVRRSVAQAGAAVVPGRADAAARCEALASSIGEFGSTRGNAAFDLSQALRLLASHLRGEYAADRRGHVAFLVVGTVAFVVPLDLVPGRITRPGFQLVPLVGFVAESVRGDIDLFADWLRWDDGAELSVSLAAAFDSWSRLGEQLAAGAGDPVAESVAESVAEPVAEPQRV